jgi:uncharacterized membrane protein YsdA (DUF1294 family)
VSERSFFIWIFLYLLAIVGAFLLYTFIDVNTEWSIYATWLATASIVTFILYGLDKGSAETLQEEYGIIFRSPRDLMHILAIAGGFIGGWLGMFLFRHKINFRNRKNRWFIPILTISTLLHSVLIYDWILGK